MAKKPQGEALKKIEALRKEEQRSEKRAKTIMFSLIGAAIIGLIALIAFILSQGIEKGAALSGGEVVLGEQLTPKTANSNNAFLVESENVKEDAKRVDVFFDPMCPGCGIVDQSIGGTLAELVDNGDISLYLSPVSFLDGTSSDKYSSRALNAFVTIAEENPRHALTFMNTILSEEFQPDEGQTYTPVPNETFVEIAKTIGVTDETATSIQDLHYTDWLSQAADKQTERTDLFPEGFSTPAVFINVKYDDKEEYATGDKVPFGQGDILETFKTTLNK